MLVLYLAVMLVALVQHCQIYHSHDMDIRIIAPRSFLIVLTAEVALSGRYLDGGRSLRVAVVIVGVVSAHAVGINQAVEWTHWTPPLVPELTTENNGSANQQQYKQQQLTEI